MISVGSYEEAWRVLAALAEFGNARANALLGYLHLRGVIPGERNLVDARRYCEFAVERGDAYGEYALAWLEFEQQNYKRAVELMTKAAQKGFLPAIADLGRIAATGTKFAAPNPEAALRQCRAAFMRGYMCVAPLLFLLVTEKTLGIWARACCALLFVLAFPVMMFGFRYRSYSERFHFHFANPKKSSVLI